MGERLRARAERGDILFGTMDSWLIWKLTGGRSHVTDATNASRSLLLDIHKGTWDEGLLKLLGVPASLLPKVVDCSGELGVATVAGVAGAVGLLLRQRWATSRPPPWVRPA